MNKYWYFSANVFSMDQKGLYSQNNGTTTGTTFPLTSVVSEVAKENGVYPRNVAVTFFSEISSEEYESYNKLREQDK